ncbi:HalOD1 output domain-containing protein [Halomarina salina]|uniref:HalOD1 output domain-containing protein n=1 Tax=Halomarina salina TaxID=1872699 RepID=A0ABD5RQY8_9EURY|nr:HalOD1 output domain-containing protein [Halomarina salina]
MSTIESPDGRVELSSRNECDHRVTHEVGGPASLSVTVVSAVSEALDADVTAVDPLYESVDPDALDSLFASATAGNRSTTRICFAHDGCSVTIYGDGEVLVTVLDD